MAAQISLQDYLQVSLPPIRGHPPPGPHRNMQNNAYTFVDITNVAPWREFNYQAIRQHYGNLLDQTNIEENRMPGSRVQDIRSENGLRARPNEMVFPRVRRALRAAFPAWGVMNGRSRLSIDVGEAARTFNNFLPDIAFYMVDARYATRANRAPGDAKPSWKWDSRMGHGERRIQQEFRQALSQANFYMKQHHTRYGFLLTDKELIAIRRLDNRGSLQTSEAIPWTAGGDPANPELTVILAMWYIGMLASQDQGQDYWYL